jgi:hypothetical protein
MDLGWRRFIPVALANIVLENTSTGPNGDMTKVFGSNSSEWLEAQSSNAAPAGTAARQLAQTDFVGIAVHCGKGGGICAGNANARPDLLPDEPGGYNGFLGLFGAKYVNPAISGGSAVVNNLHEQPITDQFGQPGFPGFDGLFATTTLAYIAQMQEQGIPVTFGYISDAHDQHGVAGEIHATRGPGEADYVQQLKNYDEAFGKFFARLATAGITKSNTLFVFTVEEGDHFVGSPPTPADCDGVNTPCTYSLVGEVNGNLTGLLATQQGITTPFTVHADMAPTIYLTGNPSPCRCHARLWSRARAAHGCQPLHHADRHPERRPRRPGRHEGATHGDGRPTAHPDAGDVRPPGLLLVHWCGKLHLALHHRADDAPDVHIRLEPRRHPAGDRDDLARHSRTRRAPPR